MKTLSIIAIALLASAVAFAKPMGGRDGGESQMMQMMGGHCTMMQRPEGALAFLKTELKITSSQEQAWNTFAAAYRSAAGEDHEDHGERGSDHKKHRKHGTAASFLDKANHHLEMMDMHHAGFRKVFDAAKPLYEALDAEQRKTADELMPHYLMPHHRGGM